MCSGRTDDDVAEGALKAKNSLLEQKQSRWTFDFFVAHWTRISCAACPKSIMSTATSAPTKQATSYLTVCTPELNSRLLRLLATQLGFHIALAILFQAKLGDGIGKL